MKNKYIKPAVEVIYASSTGILCGSGYRAQTPKIRKYGCPIKKGVDCPDYDKHMHQYEQWLNELAKRQDNAIFHQGPDENYCPHKICPIYKWKNQQKTR